MAKKAVGKIRSTSKKGMAKVIIPVKSAKSGVYSWKKTMLPVEEAEQLLTKSS